MFEVLTVGIFVWLTFKAVGLMFRLTWGIAKLIAGVLVFLAMPALLVGLIFVGGIFLLVPIGLVVLAMMIVGACL